MYDNDLYYKSDPYSNAIRVTKTGEEYMYNGVSDWLYEGTVTDLLSV